jgi:hypothetical protein
MVQHWHSCGLISITRFLIRQVTMSYWVYSLQYHVIAPHDPASRVMSNVKGQKDEDSGLRLCMDHRDTAFSPECGVHSPP